MNKPIILLGGGGNVLSLPRYNGGVKIFNLWAKLLRQHNYESYLVTQDGKYDKWLIEHQPVISFSLAKKWAKEKRNLKCMTGWLPVAKYFLMLPGQIYFYDCEIAYTSRSHFPLLKELMKSKIRAIATNSHTNQEWYKSILNYNAVLIHQWTDEEYWYPRPEMRQENLIGYMNEPRGTSREGIKKIDAICQEYNINLKFMEIAGDEQIVLDKMRQCDFYIGTNPGKHPVHGEGCPITGHEAMSTGCIVIAYDVKGNREYLDHGKTGFLAPRKRPDILARHLIHPIERPELKEQIRINSIDFALKKFSSSGKWELIRDFLELK